MKMGYQNLSSFSKVLHFPLALSWRPSHQTSQVPKRSHITDQMRSSHRRKAGQSAVSWESKHFFPPFFFSSCHHCASSRPPDWWAVALRRSSCACWLDPDASCGISTRAVIHNTSACKQKRQQKWVAGQGDDAFVFCRLGLDSKKSSLSIHFHFITTMFGWFLTTKVHKSVFLHFINLASLNFISILCYIKEFFNSI